MKPQFNNKLRFFHTTDLESLRQTWKPVYPLGKKTYEFKREKNEVFYRQSKKGDFIFSNRYESGLKISDFDFFNSIDQDIIERCRTRYIITEKNCGDVWTEVHVGKFTMNDCKFDLDRCTIEAKQNIVDEYSCLKENDGLEFNALSVGPVITTTAPLDNPYEFIACRVCDFLIPSCYNGPNPNSWLKFYEECFDIIPGSALSIYDSDDTSGECVLTGTHGIHFNNTSNQELVLIDLSDGSSSIVASGLGAFNDIDMDGDYITFTNRDGTREVLLYQISTGLTTLLDVALEASSFGHTFLKIQGDYVVFYENNGLPSGRFLKKYQISTSTLTTIYTSISGFGLNAGSMTFNNGELAYYDSDNDQYLTHDVDFGTTNLIVDLMTQPPSDIFNELNQITFYNTTDNEVQSYNFSTGVLSVVLSGVTSLGSVSGNNKYYVFCDFTGPNNLYYYEYSTGILTNTGIISPDIQGDLAMDNNDDYIVFHDSSTDQIGYFEISTGIVTNFDSQNNSTASIKVNDNNTVYYHNLEKGQMIDYNINVGVSTIAEGSFQSVSCLEKNDTGQFMVTDPSPSDIQIWEGSLPNDIKITIWYREKRSTLCVGGVPFSPSGSGWLVEEDNCGVDGVAKWVRQPVSPVLNPIIDVRECVCDQDGCETTQPTDPGQWIQIADCDANDPRSFWWLLPEDISYTRNRLLKDVVEGLVDFICPGIKGVVSDFFQWNSENPTNINYVTNAFSEVNYLSISQKSDVKFPNNTEPATIGLITWEEIVEWFRIQFEVYWFIDASNILRFEHISRLTGIQGLDLTQGKFDEFQKNQRRFSYAKEEMKRSEIFKNAEQENIDFVGYPIEYRDSTGQFSLCVTDDEEQNSLDKLTTDLTLAQNNPSALDNEGFFMFANTFDGSTYRVLQPLGAITGDSITNSTLSWANLHRDYKKWNRILPEGNLNNKFINFETTQKFKKQEKFKIPLCCEDVFDPINLMKTDLGLGEVTTAEIDYEDDMLELELKYN